MLVLKALFSLSVPIRLTSKSPNSSGRNVYFRCSTGLFENDPDREGVGKGAGDVGVDVDVDELGFADPPYRLDE